MKILFFVKPHFIFWLFVSIKVFGCPLYDINYNSKTIRGKVLSKEKVIKPKNTTITNINEDSLVKLSLKFIDNSSNLKTKASVKIAPTVYNVSGGGAYCSGLGLPIYLNGSDIGFSYQLKRNGTDVGSSIPGTGNKLTFPLQNIVGTYTVVATHTASSELATMNGNAVITIGSLPISTFKVEGGGSYCMGGDGLNINLNNSLPNSTYQLRFQKKGQSVAVDIGDPKPGNGRLDFGKYKEEGVYTVVATTNNNNSGCVAQMTGSAKIIINPLPNSHTVAGTGSFCEGEGGLPIILKGSQIGIDYRLKKDDEEMENLSHIEGTGGDLTFPPQKEGEYTVIAKDPVTGCELKMTGSAILDSYPLPSEYNMTGEDNSGSYCEGVNDVSLSVHLSNSQKDVMYQLKFNNYNEGSPISGTERPLTFNGLKKPGTYTITATSSKGCIKQMRGSFTITVNKAPEVFELSGGGAYCKGKEISLTLSGSEVEVNYYLVKGLDINENDMLPGTGSPLTFSIKAPTEDPYSVEGIYNVIGINVETGCISDMKENAEIIINPLPEIFTVSGSGIYCKEGSVTLSNSQDGIGYQLQKDGKNIGNPIAGKTGENLIFPSLTDSGIYTVIAINNTTNCEATMTGQAEMTINPLPTAFTVSGGGLYCKNRPDLSVTLSGSQIGVNYQLKYNNIDEGSPKEGTASPLEFKSLTKVGVYTITATNNITTCTAEMTGDATISIDSPVAVSGNNIVCIKEETIYTAKSGMSNYNWSVEGGTIIAGGGNNDDFAKVLWNKEGKGTVTISYPDNTACNTNDKVILDIIINDCTLSIGLEASNLSPFVDDIINFTTTIENKGNSAFSDIVIRKNLPAGLEFISSTVSHGIYNPISGIWNIPALAKDETAILTINTKVLNKDGNIHYLNTVNIESSNPVNLNNNHAEIQVIPKYLTIYNVFSPNGDGINDFFIIDHIEDFPNNTLEIYNRHGLLVYSVKGYRNNWDGVANVGNAIERSKKLPVGTYYYLLNLGTGTQEKTGWIHIQN